MGRVNASTQIRVCYSSLALRRAPLSARDTGKSHSTCFLLCNLSIMSRFLNTSYREKQLNSPPVLCFIIEESSPSLKLEPREPRIKVSFVWPHLLHVVSKQLQTKHAMRQKKHQINCSETKKHATKSWWLYWSALTMAGTPRTMGVGHIFCPLWWQLIWGQACPGKSTTTLPNFPQTGPAVQDWGLCRHLCISSTTFQVSVAGVSVLQLCPWLISPRLGLTCSPPSLLESILLLWHSPCPLLHTRRAARAHAELWSEIIRRGMAQKSLLPIFLYLSVRACVRACVRAGMSACGEENEL